MNFNVQCFEDGYGDTKCSSEEDIFLIPSFYSTFRPKPESEFINEGINQNEEMRFPYIAVEIEGEKYIVGHAASKLDSNISWVGGENKHKDIGFPIILKTCLALMANERTSDVDNLVMGLPIKADNKERKSLLNDLVVRNHNIKLSFDGKNFDEYNINVRNLITKKQPFGSLCDVILDDQGNIVEKEIAKGFNVVADIGARTFNIFTSDALDTVYDLTTHTNNGMFTAYSMVNNFIENELGLTIPDGKLPSVVKSKRINNLDLTPVIDRSYEILANEIKKVLEKVLINSWPFVDRIIFTGGGSEVLKQYLAKHFYDRNIIFLDRYSTSRGLRKYGVRQTMKMLDKNTQNNSKVYIRTGNYEQTIE